MMVDIRTLLFASAAARAGFILIFMIASFRSEARVAFRFWTVSIIGSAIGILLTYSDPQYPYFAAPRGTLIYSILGFSLSCVWAGGQTFFGRPVHRIRFMMMGVVPGIVYGCTRASGVIPDVAVMLTIATMVCLTGVAAHSFLTGGRRRYLPSQLLIGVALSMYSLALAASVIMIMARLLMPFTPSDRHDSGISLALFIDQLMSVLVYVGFIAMSLEDAQVRIRTLATTDTLTGLANRRGVQEQTLAVIAAHRRAKRPVAVLIADLDHFKSINDRHGHQGGDAVLKEFAARFSAHSRREQDVTGRWGGEEFLAVVSDMTLDEATSYALGLCRSVSETPFDIGGERITVTVSIGVAEIDRHDPSLEHAVLRADKALYDVKRAGRNSASGYALPVPA